MNHKTKLTKAMCRRLALLMLAVVCTVLICAMVMFIREKHASWEYALKQEGLSGGIVYWETGNTRITDMLGGEYNLVLRDTGEYLQAVLMTRNGNLKGTQGDWKVQYTTSNEDEHFATVHVVADLSANSYTDINTSCWIELALLDKKPPDNLSALLDEEDGFCYVWSLNDEYWVIKYIKYFSWTDTYAYTEADSYLQPILDKAFSTALLKSNEYKLLSSANYANFE